MPLPDMHESEEAELQQQFEDRVNRLYNTLHTTKWAWLRQCIMLHPYEFYVRFIPHGNDVVQLSDEEYTEYLEGCTLTLAEGEDFNVMLLEAGIPLTERGHWSLGLHPILSMLQYHLLEDKC